jgi:OFA family oxalate/formate antiporter-like MFS transporter
LNFLDCLDILDTSKAYLLVVDSKRHLFSVHTGLKQQSKTDQTEAVMSSEAALPNPRIFYGWFVVAAAFAVTLLGFGSAYTFSAFVRSLQRDFEASRGSVSLVFSLAGFLYFGLGIVSGPLADRFGSRRLAVAGMILTGLGLAAASAARSLVEVYAAYGLGVGLGVGCAYVPAIGAVQRWFVRHRGFASGLAVSGIGVGTLVMPPLASLLIESLGWRGAYLALGALAATVGGGLALLIENDPRDRGLGPDGDPSHRARNRRGPKALPWARPCDQGASSASMPPA